MLLSMVGFILKCCRGTISSSVIKFGNLCFGVYLFQQFFLIALYNETSLPSLLGAYWLPWVGFIVTLFASIVCSTLVRKTTIGRLII